MGEAVMVPGPLPRQAAEPRPLSWSALLSQPVAVMVAQGGRPLPLWIGLAWVGLGWPGLACAGLEVETVPHPPIRIAVHSTRPGPAALDMGCSRNGPSVGSFSN